MSLRPYIYDATEDAQLNKNSIIIDKNDEDVLVRRFYTTNGKRRLTKLRNGDMIVVPENTGLLIMQEGKIIDYCDYPGKFIFQLTDSDSFEPINIDKGLCDYWKDELKTYDEEIKDIKFKSNDMRLYVFNTGLLSNQSLSIHNPMKIQDNRYGPMYVRIYGKMIFKVMFPLELLLVILKNKEKEFIEPDDLIKNYIDNIGMMICQRISELSNQDRWAFDSLIENSRLLTNETTDEINSIIKSRCGLGLVDIQLISILPTAESRDKIL